MILFCFGLYYFFAFLNSIPFTCANCGLDAPKSDLIYFLTSVAISTNPVSVPNNVSFLAILELLMLVYAVATSLFLTVKLAYIAVSFMGSSWRDIPIK